MPIGELLQTPAGALIFKLGVLLGLGLYIVFTIVIIRQVHLMTDTLELGIEKPLRIVSYLYLIFGIAVFVLAFILL